ncbi:MAG: hypothetical protein V4641_09980 [Pseudomonadota bacterium]
MMAHGGDVRGFCAEDRQHLDGCEYFAEGGAPAMVGQPAPTGDDLAGQEVPDDALAGEEVPEAQLAEEPPASGQEVPDHMLADEHSSGAQMALTGVEGAAQGLLGGAAPWLEAHNPLILIPEAEKMASYEEQSARKKANPATFHGAEMGTVVGSLAAPIGQAGLIAKATEAATGSKILQGMVQGGIMQANDEVSKWALGQGDPQDPVGAATSIGAATLFGGLIGGIGSAGRQLANKGLKELAEQKFGQKATSFLQGVFSAAKSQEPEARQEAAAGAAKMFGVDMKAYRNGQRLFDTLIPASSGTLGAVKGYQKEGDIIDGAKGFLEGAFAGHIGQKALGKIGSKIIAPVLMKVLSSGKTVGAAEAIDHMASVVRGSQMTDSIIDSLFKYNPAIGQQSVNMYGSEALRKDLDDFIGNGGLTQNLQQEIYDQNGAPEIPGMAEGGEVKKPARKPGPAQPLLRDDDGVAMHYPEQHMLLSAARGRVSNYLSSLKPQPHQPKLAFDDEPDTTEQKKSYHRALDVAGTPLGVIEEIRRGTIEPEHIKHLGAMYPELLGLIQKKTTSRIVQAQVDGEKPSYKVRQGLSMLMGTALSSELTPQGIQAAQMTFAKGAHQQQSSQDAPNPKNSTTLSKSDQAYLTGSQALQKRAQKT